MLQGVYGDFLHHNYGSHLDRGVTYNAIWQHCWSQLAAQSSSWFATPSDVVGRRFIAILDAEWRGSLGSTWNSEIPLVFAHVVFIKTLGVCRAREIQVRITRMMDLWDRGIHTGLVGDTYVGGAAKEGRAAIGGEEEDESVFRSYHDMVFSGKPRQAVS